MTVVLTQLFKLLSFFYINFINKQLLRVTTCPKSLRDNAMGKSEMRDLLITSPVMCVSCVQTVDSHWVSGEYLMWHAAVTLHVQLG